MKKTGYLVLLSTVFLMFSTGCKEEVEEEDQTRDDQMQDAAGNKYKIVVINGRTWMAENMKYADNDIKCYTNKGTKSTEECSNDNSPPSSCYEDVPNFKEDYGCLYLIKDAKKVCPEGWHLPTATELKNLREYALTYAKQENIAEDEFARVLMDKTAWTKYPKEGLDAFGFDALPAGTYAGSANVYYAFAKTAYFWSNTVSNDNASFLWIWAVKLDDELRSGVAMDESPLEKQAAMSVRCIKNNN